MANSNQRWRAALLWLLLLVAIPALSDQVPPSPAPYKPEEIEALVAPIALYPDSVLAQVLMASTYPMEIVHAARWVKANPNVKGDAAVKAVENQSWDASVKSLVAFPQILEPMYDKLEWTQKLGDAFLAQQKEVFAAVQRLRSRAQESGNLKSNEQQKVIVEPAPTGGQTTIVRIEPANPQVIYVPTYNPTVVYGAWSYPAYPPTYWAPYPAYYPGAALATGFAWGVGLAAAGAIFSDCNSCWGGGDVNIDYDKVKNVDRNFERNKGEGQGGRWQHDAKHRQGVAYRDNATRDKFAGQVSGAEGRSQYRGRANDAASRAGVADRAAATSRGQADGARPANRASVADRSAGGDRATTADRSSSANRSGASNRAATSPPSRVSSGNRGNFNGGGDGAFSGVGAGSATQRNYDRGRSSVQGSGINRPSGGGGGMRGGGGRGRR